MISRRTAMLGLISSPILASAKSGFEELTRATFDQLTYPPFEALAAPELFGYKPATDEQKAKADEIVRTTPKGPKPLDIAQSFIDRFYKADPEAISQWPAPSSWNPLIVEFFSATTLHADNDMIAWCAAFANWCIERSGRNGSKSASSQSFLDKPNFRMVNTPQAGDLAVFTCYEIQAGRDLGLGHVGFFRRSLSDGRLLVVGGNQSSDGHSSIISEVPFAVSSFVRRHAGDEYIPCTMKLNTFIRVV
jgi:uncharacterized protein (TIGR02594 family)